MLEGGVKSGENALARKGGNFPMIKVGGSSMIKSLNNVTFSQYYHYSNEQHLLTFNSILPHNHFA